MDAEIEYRVKIQAVYDRIQKAMDDVDPDLAECDQSLGALTITFSDGSRCILSAQPSVRQLWLALAKEGVAYHFKLVQSAQDAQWLDDKGKGLEIIAFLQEYLRSALRKNITL